MIGRIYRLIDPITLLTRYIGQTRLTIEQRLYHHWRDRDQKKNKNNHKSSWVSKLYREHQLRPIVELVEEINDCSKKLLSEREKFWKNHYLSLGFDLTNTSDEDYIRVYKKKRDSNFKKTVYSYDKNCNETIFESAREAERVLSVDYKIISAICLGKYRTCDYVFSFTKLDENQISDKFLSKIIRKPIISTDLNTKESRIFINQLEAADYFKCNFRNINLCLKGMRKSCSNQKWTYL